CFDDPFRLKREGNTHAVRKSLVKAVYKIGISLGDPVPEYPIVGADIRFGLPQGYSPQVKIARLLAGQHAGNMELLNALLYVEVQIGTFQRLNQRGVAVQVCKQGPDRRRLRRRQLHVILRGPEDAPLRTGTTA